MFTKTIRIFFVFSSVLICGCLGAVESQGVVNVETHVASGVVVDKMQNNAVQLENGKVYYPSREGLAVDVPVGAPVTLRYADEANEKKVFFEYAPGINSLKEIQAPPSSKNRRPL